MSIFLSQVLFFSFFFFFFLSFFLSAFELWRYRKGNLPGLALVQNTTTNPIFVTIVHWFVFELWRYLKWKQFYYTKIKLNKSVVHKQLFVTKEKLYIFVSKMCDPLTFHGSWELMSNHDDWTNDTFVSNPLKFLNLPSYYLLSCSIKKCHPLELYLFCTDLF